ncbi:MAG: 3-deoxy-7-phosphoheptulonate synthase [Dethiobacteria bacterium]|jgi:3-deoxy-7-phosphoheptulonate synthase|nr:3-deoxy-7-phosphoheptulonate synthase [Bacillota bacterium]
MIVVMHAAAREEEINEVSRRLQKLGYGVHRSTGETCTVLGVIGEYNDSIALTLESMPGVDKVINVSKPFKLVSREFKKEDTVIEFGDIKIGGPDVVVIAGPCAVEGEKELLESARIVKEVGVNILRGGAFKPRTSPYSFQGLEEEGLKYLSRAREETGLLIVTEVMNQYNVPLVAEHADILQVGTRNMQNFYLLRELGRQKKPVLLKRGMSATIEEWLMAAEYILSEGNEKVILCERGIRTFEHYTRNTLDLSAVPIVKYLSHLPVIVDPSHGTGNWRWVPAMARAAIAAGADGLIVEVHPRPQEALSDGPQSLNPERFRQMLEETRQVAMSVGRRLALS